MGLPTNRVCPMLMTICEGKMVITGSVTKIASTFVPFRSPSDPKFQGPSPLLEPGWPWNLSAFWCPTPWESTPRSRSHDLGAVVKPHQNLEAFMVMSMLTRGVEDKRGNKHNNILNHKIMFSLFTIVPFPSLEANDCGTQRGPTLLFCV